MREKLIRWRARFVSSLLDDSASAYRRTSLFVAAFVVAEVALLALTGAIPQRVFGHDVPLLLEGGWRIVQGQRPHVDFSTPLGAVTFLLVAAGIKIGGRTVDALAYAVALMVAIGGAWSWIIGRRVMLPMLAATFAVAMASLLGGAHFLGMGFPWITYSAIYNRLGFALVCIILVETFSPSHTTTAARSRLGGLSTGLALCVLLFMKFTYFGAGVGIIGCATLLRIAPVDRRVWWMSFAVGFLLVFAAFTVYLNGHALAMFGDLKSASAARIVLAGNTMRVIRNIADNARDALLLVLVLFFGWRVGDSQRRDVTWRRITAIVPVAIISGIAIVSTNFQNTEIPLFSAAALVICEYAARGLVGEATMNEGRVGGLVGCLAVAALVVSTPVAGDLASIAYASATHGRTTPDEHINVPSMAGLEVFDAGSSCVRFSYAAKINSGLKILAPTLTPESRVYVMDFSNPFPFALGLHSARGDLVWWHYGTTFSERRFPSAERVFREVTHVLVPRCVEDAPSESALEQIYGPYVNAHYSMKGQNEAWMLMVRK